MKLIVQLTYNSARIIKKHIFRHPFARISKHRIWRCNRTALFSFACCPDYIKRFNCFAIFPGMPTTSVTSKRSLFQIKLIISVISLVAYDLPAGKNCTRCKFWACI